MQTVIRVEPSSLMTYQGQASDAFGVVGQTLGVMVEEAGAINYKGPNAVAFKTECSRMVRDFAQSVSDDMSRIATAVAQTTSAIAGSLGGQPIMIDIPRITSEEVRIDDPGDGTVELDTTGLEAFDLAVAAHFATIKGQFEEHVGALSRTDWHGNAKLEAVNAVTAYTEQAKEAIDTAAKEMNTYVEAQIQATRAADGVG